MILQLRRGTEAELLLITLEDGEIVFTTDTKKIYIGLNGQAIFIGGGDDE